MSGLQAPVLAADDEETDAYILRLAFAEAQVANPLIMVDDGEEVVKYLTGVAPYDDRAAYPRPVLIILDLKMRRMDGFDVLTWLQGRAEFKDIPAIVLSSSSMEADIQEARRLGARDFLVKPHHLEELIELVRTLRRRWLTPKDSAGGPSGE